MCNKDKVKFGPYQISLQALQTFEVIHWLNVECVTADFWEESCMEPFYPYSWKKVDRNTIAVTSKCDIDLMVQVMTTKAPKWDSCGSCSNTCWSC